MCRIASLFLLTEAERKHVRRSARFQQYRDARCQVPPPPPATQKKLAYLGFKCLNHPPYSPDLAPSDYHLVHELKKQLKGRHFSSDAEVTTAAETWLEGQTIF